MQEREVVMVANFLSVIQMFGLRLFSDFGLNPAAIAIVMIVSGQWGFPTNYFPAALFSLEGRVGSGRKVVNPMA